MKATVVKYGPAMLTACQHNLSQELLTRVGVVEVVARRLSNDFQDGCSLFDTIPELALDLLSCRSDTSQIAARTVVRIGGCLAKWL